MTILKKNVVKIFKLQKRKFCETCGGRLGDSWEISLYGSQHRDSVEYLIHDIHVGSYDSIAGHGKNIRPAEYLEKHGWFFGRGMRDGLTITISSFDRYVLSHECWGDEAEGFYGDIGAVRATFEEA